MYGYKVDFIINDEVIHTFTREHEGKEIFLFSRTMKGFINKDDIIEFRITPFSRNEIELKSEQEEGNTIKVKGELIINQMRHFK